MEFYETGIAVHSVAVHVVNRTLAKVIKITHTPVKHKNQNNLSRDIFFDVYNPNDQFEDTHLLPYGGSSWKRLKLHNFPEAPVLFHFHFEPLNKITIPDASIEITFTVGDNKRLTNFFDYHIDYTSKVDKEHQNVLEITIRNTSKHELICEAESTYKLGQRLREIGNDDDAVRNCAQAKYLIKDLDSALAGDIKESFKKADANIYAELAKQHMVLHFEADEKFEYKTAEVEYSIALINIKKAIAICSENEHFQRLGEFIGDMGDVIKEFEFARETEGGATALKLLGNLEYAFYECESAVQSYEAVEQYLKRWYDNPLKIDGISNACFEKYLKHLEFARIYLEELRGMYEQKLEQDRGKREKLHSSMK